jgi:hypothetical protein
MLNFKTGEPPFEGNLMTLEGLHLGVNFDVIVERDA